jgi:hypothetical protein
MKNQPGAVPPAPLMDDGSFGDASEGGLAYQERKTQGKHCLFLNFMCSSSKPRSNAKTTCRITRPDKNGQRPSNDEWMAYEKDQVRCRSEQYNQECGGSSAGSQSCQTQAKYIQDVQAYIQHLVSIGVAN